MKAAEWKKIVKPLLPSDDEWAFRGQLCYRRPFRCVLTGVMAEGSGFSTGVYVWQFTMPLFEPSEVITLSWSHRVGGGSNLIDSDDRDAVVAAVRTALDEIEDEAAALQRMAECATTMNLRVEEVAGYARIYLDDIQGAQLRLDAAQQEVDGPQWLLDVTTRMRQVDRLLADRGSDAAKEQLDEWVAWTSGQLGLKP